MDSERALEEASLADEMPVAEFVSFEEASSKSGICEDTCWGCRHLFGKKTKLGKNKALDQLNACFFENKDLHEVQLANLISSVHEKLFVASQDDKNDIEIWSPKSVLTHIRGMLDPELTFRRNIHDLNVLEENTKNSAHTKAAGGRAIVDSQALSNFVQITKLRTTLFAAIKALGK